MDLVQSSRREARRDAVAREPQLDELPPPYRAFLPLRQLRHPPFPTSKLLFDAFIAFKCRFGGHAGDGDEAGVPRIARNVERSPSTCKD
jgi:hypothetical protein